MIQGVGRIRRALWCVAGAALVGVPVALLAMQTVYWFSYTGQEAALVMALALCLGLGAAIGHELAAAGQSRAATQKPAWAWILAGSLALVALILLGILGGALLIPLTRAHSPTTVIETEIAVACVVFGLTAAAMITRWHIDNAALAAALTAVLGVLYAVSFDVAYVMTDSLTFHCPPGARCLINTWRWFLPSDIAQYALPIGLWLGLTLWGALALARRNAAPQPAPATS